MKKKGAKKQSDARVNEVEETNISHNENEENKLNNQLRIESERNEEKNSALLNTSDYIRLSADSLINRIYSKATIYPDDTWLNQLISKTSSFDNQLKLEGEISELKRKLQQSVHELQNAKADKADLENKIVEFKKLKNELTAKEKISHILTRISEAGREKLLESEDFQNLFKNFNKCEAVVVAIDIRRSTELMLKARSPELFSKFITELSFKLSQVIIFNFGVFDKFTGDGILAFFPKFYSGSHAIIRSIKAANECHQIFKKHYYDSKNCFNVFIKDVGLGIGIDYGIVTLVNTQSELTVVGIPVVYACRFSGAKAGETLINQPAKEEIMNLCPNLASFNECEINIKNEGTALGYNVTLNETAYNIQDPNWDDLTTEFKNH